MADARKSLQVLHDEWVGCDACELGQRRQATGGAFVWGEGVQRGILFIGEGPGRVEEEEGRPFVGPSGKLLRDALAKLKIPNYYITNLVSCRACEAVIDPATNTPKIMKGKYGRPDRVLFRDQVPTPKQIDACKMRLWEEIYIIDPVLIVTLGATAAEVMLGRSVSITRERGRTEHCTVPGVTYRASHTERKGVWGRRLPGKGMCFPVEQNEVQYLVLPTLHPAYVLRKLGDHGANSPVRQFGEDLRTAAKIYERYTVEALGIDSMMTLDVDLSNIGAEYEPEEGTA